jgi:magnesium chelatase family protein
MPARFQLVAAMNPCPCGHAGDPDSRCTCAPGVVERYQARISGPLRDRIDLWVGMARVRPSLLLDRSDPEGSAAVAARIAAARSRQLARPGRRLNARLSGRALRRTALLEPASQRRLVNLADVERLSGRGTDRVLRVARTIADLAGSDAVEAVHLDEAARWRVPVRSTSRALAV